MDSIAQKRLAEASVPDRPGKRATYPSPAARFNENTLKKLKRALETNPEVDLAKALPSHYSLRLEQKRSCQGKGLTI